jgi:superoxide dismutase
MRLSEPELKPVLRVQATLDIHWGKHHRTYVTNLNGQVEGTDMESKSLEEVRTRCTVPILIRSAVHAGVDAWAEECCGLLCRR